MHRIKNELNKLISNTILIVQLHQLKTQTNTYTRHTRRWKKFEDVFIRFDRIHERDRQTDRHPATA